MVFTTQCSQCGKILWFASNRAGKMTICPACGAVMQLVAPVQPDVPLQPLGLPLAEAGLAPASPETSPQHQAHHESDDRPPAAAQEALLTHQVAAAMGEVHVEMDESDTIDWPGTAQPPVPAGAPPVWSPPPLGDIPQAPAPSDDVIPGFPPISAAAMIPSGTRPSWAVDPEDASRRRQVVLWAMGAVGVVALVIGVLWLLRGNPPDTWEATHRQQILDMKQTAEDLSLAGKDREAYEKYQELERLVEGQVILDPYLNADLDRARERREAMFDVMTGRRKPTNLLSEQNPTTAPSKLAITGPDRSAISPSTVPSTPPTGLSPDDTALLGTSPSTEPEAVVEPPPRPSWPRPAAHTDIPPPQGITDAQIGASINKGADFLIQRFNGPVLAGSFDHYDGLDTLVVYALMQAGLANYDKRLDIHGEFLINAIDAMKKFPMTSDYVTYARALRATALALYDRPQDHPLIKQDVNWLLKSQEHGAFTYNNDFARETDFSFWDNSNSQYGLLGVWSGAEVGIQVPSQFWREVRAHWDKCQLPDGEWGYRNDINNPSRSMTLAGIASLFVAQDYLDPEEFNEGVGRPPFGPALDKGLKWLETGDNSVISLPHSADYFVYYALYGLERTGLASGFKYYGTHDWYRERAAEIIAAQNANGSWGSGNDPYETLIDTAYSLLFLARGRHPILMNKLRFDGDWANRPRDVANLARFASDELERPLNWQEVPLNRDWQDWTDSPILYMASDKAPELADEDRDKLKSYILNGGMLLLQSDAGRAAFTSFAEDLGTRLFPDYPWTDLPANSPLYSVSYRLQEHAKIRVISNGSRILMMLWPQDLSRAWQLRQQKLGRSTFELGVNLALYAAGKSELKNRLARDYIEMPGGEAQASFKLAQLSYDGNWNPEPAAWPRAARWFRQQTAYDLSVAPMALKDLATANPPIAHLTGTGKMNVTAAEIQSVKSYVEKGGVLIIDPCGLPDEFLRSAHDDLLIRAFHDAKVQTVPGTHPLLSVSAGGMTDVSHPEIRQFARLSSEGTDTRPAMLSVGQGHVIILPLDLTSGLLGTDAWGIAGYQPDYSLELMKNLVLWTWDGQKEQ